LPADPETHEITIGEQTYVMPEEGGSVSIPSGGAEITLFYKEEGVQNVITRIGPKQE
jgi:hypothetical protein